MPRLLTLIPTMVALLALPALPACRAVHAPMHTNARSLGDPDAHGIIVENSAETPTSIWPARWGEHPSKRGVIVDLDPTIPMLPIHYSRYHQGRSTPQDYEDSATLAAAMGITDPFKFMVEGPGSFVFIEDPFTREPIKDPPQLSFKFISAQRVGVVDDVGNDSQDSIALERTWFTFRDPKDNRENLGTIVLLPGMFGTPEPIVDAAERFWHTKGYAVLRMRSHPARYTQHLTLSYLDGRSDSVATRAARSADQRVAECAYATSAALDHVFAKRETLSDRPVVLVGMSGGAMALPSVYAYTPDRYDAAVLIAGGANFLRIMIDSNYRDWIDAILIDFDPSSDGLGEPAPEVVDSLSERYLDFAKLDAYTTAPLMRDIPVLILHATNDKAVPAKTGDLLYERLGKPERWTYPLGHELIFAGLPTQIPRIDKWLSAQLQPDSESED